MTSRGALTAVAQLALLALAGPPASAADDPLVRALPPALRDVLEPRPALRGTDVAARVAWLEVLARRADAGGRHSGSPAWRAIMGWGPDDLAGNAGPAPDVGLGRYPTPEGRADPAADFARSVAALARDPRLACAFPMRARYLARRGLIASPTWLEAGRCARFERWARLDDVAGIELLYVTPRWEDPGATVGHVLLRVRQRRDRVAVGPSFEPVVSWVAEADVDDPGYVWDGLTGGYDARVRVEPYGDVAWRYNVSEGRDVVAYALRLTAEERRDLLATVHAQIRGGSRVPYRFLSDNCASLLWRALRAALPDLPAPPGTLPHPHEVASALVAAGRAERVGVTLARAARGVRAERSREDEGDVLVAADPRFAALHAARWEGAEERARALVAAERWAADIGAAEVRALAARYVDAWIDVESAALDAAAGFRAMAPEGSALDAALALRARLPVRAGAAGDPDLDRGAIGPSGSRHVALAAGVDATGSPRARIGLALVDERPGELRSAQLRRRGRTTLLASETELAWAWDGDAPELVAQRIVVLGVATYGASLRTDRGWLASRLGWAGEARLESLPSRDVDLGLVLSGGPALTVAASEDFGAHLVLGVSARLAAWAVDGRELHAGAGPWIEVGLPISSAGHRLAATARLEPYLELAGPGLAAAADLGAAWVLDARAGLLLTVGVEWRVGGVDARPLTAWLGLGW